MEECFFVNKTNYKITLKIQNPIEFHILSEHHFKNIDGSEPKVHHGCTYRNNFYKKKLVKFFVYFCNKYVTKNS